MLTTLSRLAFNHVDPSIVRFENVCGYSDPLRLGEIVSVGSEVPMRAVVVGRAYQWGEIRYDVMVEKQVITNIERGLITKLDGECIHIDVIDDRVAKPTDPD